MTKAKTDKICIARCESCGQALTAKIRVDGTLRPVGVASCPCGGSDFERVTA